MDHRRDFAPHLLDESLQARVRRQLVLQQRRRDQWPHLADAHVVQPRRVREILVGLLVAPCPVLVHAVPVLVLLPMATPSPALPPSAAMARRKPSRFSSLST